MRKNLPVTNVEYVLKDTETVVSKTDLKGNITYVNQDFINISGFSEEELLGAPQNIVRHPDMPREAFEDFWRTIKAGKAWTGLVKNRCKNGDHYWVEANAAPMLENGQVVGYTSIRIKPSREQVAAAEKAYEAIRNGSKDLEIREGAAIKRSAFNRLNLLAQMSIKSKVVALTGLPTLLFAVIMGDMLLSASSQATEVIALAATGVGLSTVLGFSLYRAVVAPLHRARHDIEKMSAGDLTGKILVERDDEVGSVLQALRVLQTNVKLLVGQIKEATDVVNVGASEIAAGNADLSSRTESQASSLEETASSMEELTGTVKQNADNATQAHSLVSSASQTATKGGTVVKEVVTTMGTIRESSQRIADIITVIDGIAFQTNILALNAAVEAARAGEQGRGFAVVASEVRSLAQRSALAAKEIKELITDSVAKVSAGGKLVDDAGKTMEEIVVSVKQVADIMGEITAASAEQASGIGQVNQAVAQMDQMTQQNSALVEEAAAAASEMRSQAAKLSQLVASFRLVQGSGSNTLTPPKRSSNLGQPARAGLARSPKKDRIALAA